MLLWLTRNLFWSQAPILLSSLGALALIGFWFRPLLYCACAGILFCLLFFRNPERHCSEALTNSKIIVCPADGKIVTIENLKNDPQFGYRIAIFLSPLDVHVNWIPLAGKIEKVEYRKGAFMMAFLPKSSELNERNDILLKTSSDRFVQVRQIAGTIARKIVCWVREGEQVKAGQSFGMIKFSSRIELFLPSDTKISVEEGQTVYGGQTVVGMLQ